MVHNWIFGFAATAGMFLTLHFTGAKADDRLVPPKEAPQWVMLSSNADGKITTEYAPGPHDETVVQTYSVQVPYVRTKSDGTKENLMRTEQKQREVTVKRLGPHKVTWRAKDLKFLDVLGNELDYEREVVDRIRTPVAALAVTKPKVHPFYAAILKRDAIVVVVPAKNPKQRERGQIRQD